jgi:DNA polymerase I
MTRPPLAFDLETYGERKKEALQPMRGDARLLTLCVPGKTISFDLKASGYSSADWPAIFRDREVIAHNARFDAAWVLEKLGVRLPNVFCTLTACQLLSQGDRTLANDLGAALERYLGVKIPKGFGKSDWGGMFLVEDQLRYAAEDVQYLHALRDKLEEELKAAKLWGTFQLEMLLLPVVVDMQSAGIPISRERLGKVLEEAEVQRKEYADQLKTHLGWINLDSPDQVLKAFKGVGVDLTDTAEKTLKDCLHPAAEILLEYRAKEKVCQQVETLREAICSDGRIHAEFKPMGTDTGRFASSSPNMQNIGRGPLRSCFIPSNTDKVARAGVKIG